AAKIGTPTRSNTENRANMARNMLEGSMSVLLALRIAAARAEWCEQAAQGDKAQEQASYGNERIGNPQRELEQRGRSVMALNGCKYDIDPGPYQYAAENQDGHLG